MCPALGVLKPLPASGGFSPHPHHRRAFLASFFIIGNVYRSLKVQKKIGEMQIVVGGYLKELQKGWTAASWRLPFNKYLVE
jgi:hypothetical protein